MLGTEDRPKTLDELVAERASKRGPEWYCLYTGARCEAKAAVELHGLGYTVFAPVVRKKVKVMRAGRRRDRIIELPLLTRYIFIEMAPGADWSAVKETDGVTDFLRDEIKGPRRVPRFAIEDLQAAEDMGLFDETITQVPVFNAGAHVRIVEGPFTGLPAIVEHAIAGETAAILLSILGRETRMLTPLENLRPAA